MRVQFTLTSPIQRSARALQMAGMFDVPLVENQTRNTWDVALPIEDRDWLVGLIVGPSGSGKTSLARYAWPDRLAAQPIWSSDRTLLDDFPSEMGIRDVVELLTSVGLSSPPAWLRPRDTLSNGEGFRADMARALATSDDLVVVDEFTSVVDRQVAKVVSHTVQRTVRRDRGLASGQRFVAVSCHSDIIDWLQPDWVMDMKSTRFEWRFLQRRPALDLAIHRSDATVWPAFRRHHYLSGDFSRSAQVFTGHIGDDMAAMVSYLHFPHPRTRNLKIAHRVVVLPDYQGLGIAGRMQEWLGQRLADEGFRYRYVSTHPAVINACRRSPRWREQPKNRHLNVGRHADPQIARRHVSPRRLLVSSFEYQPVGEIMRRRGRPRAG